MPKGSRLVTAISITCLDKYIVASDASETPTAHVFSISGGKKPFTSIKINYKITHLACNPVDNETFATVGKDHFYICTIKDAKVSKMSGKVKDKTVDHCAVAFVPSSKYPNTAFTGANDGLIYQFNKEKLVKTVEISKKTVTTIVCVNDEPSGGIIVLAGTTESMLFAFSFDGELKNLFQIQLEAVPRSIDLMDGMMLIGLKNGNINVAKFAQPDQRYNIMTSHCEGEVWGLDIIDLGNGVQRIITTADDNRVIVYDSKTFQPICEGYVE